MENLKIFNLEFSANNVSKIEVVELQITKQVNFSQTMQCLR
jgi:hypothetical protein